MSKTLLELVSIKRECGLSLKRFVFVFPSGIYIKYKQLLAKDKLIFRRLSKVSTEEFRLESLSMVNSNDIQLRVNIDASSLFRGVEH